MTINFANSFQAVAGLDVTAEDFLRHEGVSSLAFACAASERGRDGLAAEFDSHSVTVKTIDPALFEKAVRGFLLAIWRNGQDATEALGDVDPALLLVVGKAADAIEARHGLQWGVRSTPEKVALLIEECSE